MNRRNNILTMLVFFGFTINVFSQKEIGNETPEVKVIAYASKSKIYLRWGVTTPIAWKLANRYGYTIERKTIVRNKEVLALPEIKILSTSIKPKPMMEWKDFTFKNKYAAIAAQALYGEDFNVDMNQGGNGIINILNQAQAEEQRFSFALYAADQDFEVATFLGLGFVDSDVKPDERYLYTIKVNSDKKEIKEGGVFLGLLDNHPLPKPQEFVGVFKDKSVLLSWNFAILKKYYTNYIIEKSEDDGVSFKSIAPTPITKIGEKEINPSKRILYIDSIANNNTTYQYRIKGVSPFGIEGPYSNIIKGKGVTPLIYNPFITRSDIKDNYALLNWNFPKEGIKTLSHFELMRANKVKGNYIVVKKLISKGLRSIKISDLRPINYYKIVAVGKDGSKRESFPTMIQPDDSTPPAIPVNLNGTIDSTGVVTINWKLNLEPDFLGYRVFRAYLKENEFTQLTFEPTPYNTFNDTINLKTLNKEVYYKIQSFDKRYNPSKFSEILILKKPDVVPPSKPVFVDFKVKNKKVNLSWVTSSSNDAKSTLLYRKEKGISDSWQLLKELPLPKSSYTDSTAVATKTYLYTILTVDDSGLESEPVTPLTITISDNMPKPEITDFKGEINRENEYIRLAWSYKHPNIDEYILYKASERNQPTMYKIFKNTINSFKDNMLKINTKYTYLLQAVFKSGSKSPLKKIELNY